MEKQKLFNEGLIDKSKEVHKVDDGLGYDIFSYDIRGNKIHIEVKTTIGNIDVPFYMSITEKDYLEKHPENYYLYRLHEFRFIPSKCKVFILSAKELIRKAKFKPTNFEISKSDTAVPVGLNFIVFI